MCNEKNHEKKLKVLLVSNFEGGYQPISIATAYSALIENGFNTTILDTYVEGIREDILGDAELVAISIPLFDALFSGIEIAKTVKKLNKNVHVTFFGQYASINANRLTPKYSDSCIVGQWEDTLVQLANKLEQNEIDLLPTVLSKAQTGCCSEKEDDSFYVPNRKTLPPLYKYPQDQIDKLCGGKQIIGGTEITRGCHHKCLYCSVYASYEGKVHIIPEDVVITDVTNLVEQGMTHLTFMDADFFNSKYHGINIIRTLHSKFPKLTYDFTTRIDHINEHKEIIAEMADLGVKFITTAVEFPCEEVVDEIAKEITLEDIEEALGFLQETSIKINPTFIMFNPWIKLENLIDFKTFVNKNNLDDIIDPIQYETRLHIYKGSPLLKQKSIQDLDLIEHEFNYEWKHSDPRVDEVYNRMVTPVEEGIFKRCCLKC
ncbi:RCCLKC-tail radical SAM protein [Clostridium sp. C8-1-8]|uniref:arsinothricin biosynthesis radical SAM protein ArsL n=1 Tax=Clostridium sp. C8-1-8 TaxID=2698831 RepID=UPI00136B8A47|nr:RCCLKC-tail radical SAM protein [Clostridium sp. C8-1-8]